MQYKITPEIAKLDKNKLAKNAGWLLIYLADENSREYIGASYEFLLADVGIPAHSYLDAPEIPAPGYAIVRAENGQSWEYIPDHRGKTVFDIHTREPVTVTVLGDLPDNFTERPPTTAFDVWDGEKWVTDVRAQHAAAVDGAERKKESLRALAESAIAPLQDAVDLDIASDKEKAQLIAWKKYRVLLSRVDTSAAPDIEWPEPPTSLFYGG